MVRLILVRHFVEQIGFNAKDVLNDLELAFVCTSLLQAVTLHTNLGDIKCEIACDEVPKAAEVGTHFHKDAFSSVCFRENGK